MVLPRRITEMPQASRKLGVRAPYQSGGLAAAPARGASLPGRRGRPRGDRSGGSRETRRGGVWGLLLATAGDLSGWFLSFVTRSLSWKMLIWHFRVRKFLNLVQTISAPSGKRKKNVFSLVDSQQNEYSPWTRKTGKGSSNKKIQIK